MEKRVGGAEGRTNPGDRNRTITGEDVAAVVDGTQGPLVDGRPYADPVFRTQLEAYHAAVVRAHREHGGVDAAIPVPLPPPPADATGNGSTRDGVAIPGDAQTAPRIEPGIGDRG